MQKKPATTTKNRTAKLLIARRGSAAKALASF